MPEPSPADQNTDAEAEASSFPGRSSKTGLLLMGTDGTLSWLEPVVAVGQERRVGEEGLIEELWLQLTSSIAVNSRGP